MTFPSHLPALSVSRHPGVSRQFQVDRAWDWLLAALKVEEAAVLRWWDLSVTWLGVAHLRVGASTALIALAALGLSWGAALYPITAVAAHHQVGPRPVMDVVELVDFSCPHCRTESQYVPQIAKAVQQHGGVFRIAPVGPQQGGIPAPAVSVYYALLTEKRNSLQTSIAASQAFYAGYQAQADLSTLQGVLSWLDTQMTAVPHEAITKLLSTQHVRQRFWRAVFLANQASASLLPAFVFISAKDGAVLGVSQWRGNAGELAKQVLGRTGG